MLYKHLVSLVVAFVTTSSVAASATPMRRGVGGLGPGYGLNPTAPPVNQCNSGVMQCCDGSGNCNNVDVLGGSKCDETVFCCPGPQSTLINIECVRVIDL